MSRAEKTTRLRSSIILCVGNNMYVCILHEMCQEFVLWEFLYPIIMKPRCKLKRRLFVLQIDMLLSLLSENSHFRSVNSKCVIKCNEVWLINTVMLYVFQQFFRTLILQNSFDPDNAQYRKLIARINNLRLLL